MFVGGERDRDDGNDDDDVVVLSSWYLMMSLTQKEYRCSEEKRGSKTVETLENKNVVLKGFSLELSSSSSLLSNTVFARKCHSCLRHARLNIYTV